MWLVSREGGELGLKDQCVHVLQSKLTWGPYVWFHMWRAATSTISGRSTRHQEFTHQRHTHRRDVGEQR